MADPLHVIIPTHTTRYLDLVLVALARQTRRADSITVSCDTDDPAIGELIGAWANRLGLEIAWVRRAAHESERLCQVRNNAVRYLVETLAEPAGRLVVLDGDMIAGDDCLERHATLGAGLKASDLILPYRVNVDEPTSRGLDAARLLSGEHRLKASPAHLEGLRQRDIRARKHLLMRRLRLGDLHKPKLLGGHFSCTLDLYLRLNGFDELYQGWGFKDDEFAYRAARAGATVRPAAGEIIAFHLFHQTRQPDAPMATLPTARRFEQRRTLPVVAEHGVENPLEQHEVETTVFPGGVLSRRA
jgi:hypothetical protein